jgi:hypothetical protein
MAPEFAQNSAATVPKMRKREFSNKKLMGRRIWLQKGGKEMGVALNQSVVLAEVRLLW